MRICRIRMYTAQWLSSDSRIETFIDRLSQICSLKLTLNFRFAIKNILNKNIGSNDFNRSFGIWFFS